MEKRTKDLIKVLSCVTVLVGAGIESHASIWLILVISSIPAILYSLKYAKKDYKDFFNK